jgi:hypothetical protein
MRYIEINGARTYLTFDEREIYEMIEKADNSELSATVLDEFQLNIAEQMYSKGTLLVMSSEDTTIFSINYLSPSLWRY